MKWAFAAACVVTASADEGSPIAKVLQMISDLQAKIIKEGEEVQKTYNEVEDWCKDRSVELQQEIKTSKTEIMNLNAGIEKDTATIATSTTKIEQVAGEIASTEADLAAATKIRNKESADFKAFEVDITGTIDTLERAVGVIEKEFNMGASALVQFKHSGSVVQALSAMVSAEAISSDDGRRLTALVQSDSDDDDMGAPAAAAYAHGQGVPPILETLNGLLDKANAELEGARQTEKGQSQKFEMLAMSLRDQVKFANKELAEEKKTKAEAEESKGTAEGDLGVTTADLNEDVKTLAEIHHDCMSKAEVFETEVKSRGEELKALAEAKKIVIEATSLEQTSFLQLTANTHNVGFSIVRKMRAAAKKQHSTELAQLASRMDTTIRFASGSREDVFAAIRKQVEDMIKKIEEEGEADTTEKAFCDKELPYVQGKKDDKVDEIEKLTAKIDKMTAESKTLKTEAAAIEEQLGALLQSQAEMTKIRQEEKATYEATKPDLEKAIAGIQKALKVLNDYYSKAGDAAHGSSGGASSGIIGLLEVAESDFSKELAELTDAEEKAQYFYDQETKENELAKLKKEQDVKYKAKAAASLDKSVSEYSSDKAAVEEEDAAVSTQLAQLKKRCADPLLTYEVRVKRREEKMASLKESMDALNAMGGEPAEGEVAAEAAPAAEGEPAVEGLIQSKHFMSVRRH